jgi:hypothetical protein
VNDDEAGGEVETIIVALDASAATDLDEAGLVCDKEAVDGCAVRCVCSFTFMEL